MTLTLIRSVLTAVLVSAAASKLRSRTRFEEFVASLDDARIASRRVTRVSAALLVFTELSLSIVVWVPGVIGDGLIATASLFVLLTAAVWIMVLSGRAVRCRCFGSEGAVLTLSHVARNASLTAVALIGVAVDYWGRPPAGWPGVEKGFVACLAGTWIASGFVCWDELAFVVRGRTAVATEGDKR